MKALAHKSIENRYDRIKSVLNEQTRRLWAASEALELGYGGISAVSRATGLAPITIRKGLEELKQPLSTVRQRAPGGGRKNLTDKDPSLQKALDKLIEPYSSGDPMRLLRWTCKSTSNLAEELRKAKFKISAKTVARLLKENNYSLQSNRKRFEGRQHEDRNAQFEYIATSTEEFQMRDCPVISVDAKKKELVGNYKNAGQEWTPKGAPLEVKAYDFIDKEKGKVTPYGVYDTSRNEGWVSVGIDHDTAEFAVQSINRWWEHMGEWNYPDAKEILILADGGGSNGSRSRLWKKSLQEWADKEGLKIMVCHFPPGTSKWNKIEHRMFCHITRNWRGIPLVSHEVIVNLIGSTRTEKGLEIKTCLDTGSYPTGIKVSDAEMEQLSIELADFHGEWNYVITPRVG